MKYEIKFAGQFKKDLKLAKKQGKNLDKLFDVREPFRTVQVKNQACEFFAGFFTYSSRGRRVWSGRGTWLRCFGGLFCSLC